MDLRNKLISIIPLVLIFLFFGIVIFFFDNSLEKTEMHNNLMWITPIFFGIALLLILAGFLWGFKDIKKLFSRVDKRAWIILILIIIGGLYMRTAVAPFTHRLYYDEDIYLNIAQNIVKEGRTILCNYGNQEQCFEGVYNKQPNGYPFLMSIIFFFVVSETVAHYATAILSTMIIPIVFLIAYLMFKSNKIAILSSLFFSLIPITIIWAPTTTAGSVSILFMGLAFLALLAFLKTRKTPILLLFFSSLAYAVQLRPEGLLFLVVIALALMLFDRKLFEDIRKKNWPMEVSWMTEQPGSVQTPVRQ